MVRGTIRGIRMRNRKFSATTHSFSPQRDRGFSSPFKSWNLHWSIFSRDIHFELRRYINSWCSTAQPKQIDNRRHSVTRYLSHSTEESIHALANRRKNLFRRADFVLQMNRMSAATQPATSKTIIFFASGCCVCTVQLHFFRFVIPMKYSEVVRQKVLSKAKGERTRENTERPKL